MCQSSHTAFVEYFVLLHETESSEDSLDAKEVLDDVVAVPEGDFNGY